MPYKNKINFNTYMRKYLPEYRKAQAELLQKAKVEYGWVTPKQKQRRKRK